MIIQNLLKIKIMSKRIVLFVFLGLLYNPFFSFSQDSIPITKDITEENEIKFQEHFFKSLSEKSIKNYHFKWS